MNDEQRVPFGQTTAGIILIQGVVTAVVSAVVTWAINNAADLPWLAIAALFVGIGLTVFLVLSLFRERLRRAMWGWVPRLAGWLSGLRITTSKGRAALVQAGYAERDEEQQKKDAEMTAAAAKQSEQVQGFIKEMLDKPRPLPSPEPRWKVTLLDETKGRQKVIEVRNLMPRSVANNVRVEVTPKGAFHFADAAFWPDLSGEAEGVFRGTATAHGAQKGFKVVLSWLDEDRDTQSESWTIAATEEDPNDVWGSPPF